MLCRPPLLLSSAMGIRGRWTAIVCTTVVVLAAFMTWAAWPDEPSPAQQRQAHLDKVSRSYKLGQSEGATARQQKIAKGTPPAYAEPDAELCQARWDRFSAGDDRPEYDESGFLAGCLALSE